MKPANQVVLLLFSFLLCLFSFQAFAENNHCKLTLGYDSWEPYQYLDVGNEVRGLDIDLMLMVTKRMSCKVDFKQGAWIDLLALMKNGEIDVLLGASKTERREQFALFSEPYRTEQFTLYVKKDDKQAHQLKTFSDFIANGKKLGVMDDYYYGDEVSQLQDSNENGQFVSAIIGEMNIARLLDDNIDAFIEDSIVGASMIRRKGLSTLIVPHNLSITSSDVYVMFSKKSVSPEIVKRFNLGLKGVKQSGEYDALLKMYKL
ncbi:MAG: transporter substrate-binding domain-containing protein [Gammaproteobacteria bacterium]|nr:transporter substrate-binding domain-containing protein [Gammaproteobacteria bacterium]